MKNTNDDRGSNGDSKAYGKCSDGPNERTQICLVGRGAGADDRIEQRRNHHGTDNDGRTVHPEAQGTNNSRSNGQQQEIEIDFRALREIMIGLIENSLG